METAVRCVGFGGGSVSGVITAAASSDAGASVDFVEVADLADFSHGEIDWRGRLEHAHWLVLSASTVLAGDSARSAQGAGMTFAEFEGPRVVMIVDQPDDTAQLAEAWGFVIERIRQIHILFLTEDALAAVASIEEMDSTQLLSEIRLRGMVPQVIAFEPSEKRVRIEHSLGAHTGSCSAESTSDWLGRYLCELPRQGPGADGIAAAANRC